MFIKLSKTSKTSIQTNGNETKKCYVRYTLKYEIEDMEKILDPIFSEKFSQKMTAVFSHLAEANQIKTFNMKNDSRYQMVSSMLKEFDDVISTDTNSQSDAEVEEVTIILSPKRFSKIFLLPFFFYFFCTDTFNENAVF